MAAHQVWAKDEDFWTSDEEDRSTQLVLGETTTRTEEDNVENSLSTAFVPKGETKSFYNTSMIASLAALGVRVDESTFHLKAFEVTGKPRPIPDVTVVPPEDEKVPGAILQPKKVIRKRWVIEDDSDVSQFDQDVPKNERPIEYPFELDAFQKRSIRRLHRNEHVFVAAHTSAGKTAVAEYAIALAAKDGLRAVYTSPIKALSNQKFREFRQKFESVGVITGDVNINPEGQCLIMTTEILRSMLYRGDPLIGQLAVVIFDEIHYVNDIERGVVWEETLILLPRGVGLVMLSATVPNYLEFADWIGRTKQREVFAVATNYRPTPLRHFLWSNDQAIPLMDNKNTFNPVAYRQMYEDLRHKEQLKQQAAEARAKGKAKAKAKGAAQPTRSTGQKGTLASQAAKLKTDIHRLQGLLRKLDADDKLPVVAFCFSRRKCETYAISMPNLDITSSEEKSRIHLFVKECLATVNEHDRQLPQVVTVAHLLVRGIGAHHGGLLPIVKEMVEILFQRGLVRVLFATETFAMGVNMPARSVVFTSVHKHDGRTFRMLQASEYTQMAGRAGRRGLDDYGNVYVFCGDEASIPDQKELTTMMLAKANPLNSKFRLTFQMLLQLFSRANSMKVEDMISKSFRESHRSLQRPILKRDLQRRQKELEGLPSVNCVFGEPTIEDYSLNEIRQRRASANLYSKFWQLRAGQDVFTAGRVVVLHSLPFCLTTCCAVIVGQDGRPLFSSQPPKFRCLALVPPGVSVIQGGWESLNVEDKFDLSPLESEDVVGALRATKQTQQSPLANEITAFFVERVGQASVSMHGSACEYIVIGGVSIDQLSVVSSEFLQDSQSRLVALQKALDDLQIINSLPRETKVDSTVLGWNGNEILKGFEAQSRCPSVDLIAVTAIALELNRLMGSCNGSPPPYSLPKALKQLEMEFYESLLKQKDLQAKIQDNKCTSCFLRERHFALARRRQQCEDDIRMISSKLRTESLDLWPELQAKQELMKTRGFLDRETGSVTLKGRVACEITSSDEITLTEVIFENVLQDKTPEEIASLLSAFVFPEKSDDEDPPLGPTGPCAEGRALIEKIHWEIFDLVKEMRIQTIDEESWSKLCNFKFSTVAYRWAEGTPFNEIMEMTTLQEGTIVRTILRLEELTRKIKGAAQIIGNTTLERKMEETSERIRRDIVFAMSLYLVK